MGRSFATVAAGLWALLALCALGHAKTGTGGGYLEHRVEAGETLPSIAQRYLQRPAQWRVLQHINGIADPQALPPDRVVRIPARLLRPAAVVAQVEQVRGPTTATAAGPTPAPQPVTAGASLSEGARIAVPADGYVSLRLADGSVVRILAGSDVALQRLRRRNHASDFETVLHVRRGRVESDVAPQPKGRVFEIQAPGAVASVRGTRFDMSVDAQGRVGTTVTHGEVALRALGAGARHRGHTQRVGAGERAVLGRDGRWRLQPAPASGGAVPSDGDGAALGAGRAHVPS